MSVIKLASSREHVASRACNTCAHAPAREIVIYSRCKARGQYIDVEWPGVSSASGLGRQLRDFGREGLHQEAANAMIAAVSGAIGAGGLTRVRCVRSIARAVGVSSQCRETPSWRSRGQISQGWP
jgi:hypothetical protein